jgi:AcrR family transcriptional regulator
MDDEVNPPTRRSYSSALRSEQAASTRARIVDAAARRFLDQGYATTTMRQIADEAGVAVDTVYATFGKKVRVLTAVIDARLAPGGEDSVLQRPEALAVRDEPDPREQLRRFAHDIAAISEHVRPIFELLRIAAATEPEVAPVYREMETQRARNMQVLADWVGAHGPLRVDADRAGATVWAVTSPDLARLLCDLRGWSRDQYAAWLEDVLARVLLEPGPG